MSDDSTPAHIKYKASNDAHKATLYRSAFAIRSELEPALKTLVEQSNAPSVSGMLTLMARAPEECAQALRPIFERLQAQEPPMRRRHKVTIKSVVEEMRSGELSPAELAEAIAQAKAKKAEAGQ
jgi:hypothetical protein